MVSVLVLIRAHLRRETRRDYKGVAYDGCPVKSMVTWCEVNRVWLSIGGLPEEAPPIYFASIPRSAQRTRTHTVVHVNAV